MTLHCCLQNLFSDAAIAAGGPPGTVAALTGLYPQMTLVLTMLTGMEKVTFNKVMGLAAAAASISMVVVDEAPFLLSSRAAAAAPSLRVGGLTRCIVS